MSYKLGNMDRDHYHMKQAAAEYYRALQVPERLEQALNSTFYLRPRDVYGHLANYFEELSQAPVISDIRGRKVLGGTGNPAIEVEICCTVKNIDKTVCSTIMTADMDFASHEALDAGEKERITSVDTAIEWIKNELNPLIKGIPPNEQSRIDQLLSGYFRPKREEEKDRLRMIQEANPSPKSSIPTPTVSPKPAKKKGSGKGKKTTVVEKPIPPQNPPEPVVPGSLAIGAVSLAIAKSNAVLNKTPLYLHIAALKNEQMPTEFIMPAPMISLLSSGKSSPGKLNLMKEVIVIPKPGHTLQQGLDMALSLQNHIAKQLSSISKTAPAIKNVSPLGCLLLGCDRIDQPLDLICEACKHLGLVPGTDLHLALNCAAHELMDYNKGKYEVVSGTLKTPDEMVDMYLDLINRYPSVLALLDPLRKEDILQWQNLDKALASKCYVVSDVASVSVSGLLEGGNTNIPSSAGTVIKYTNETTISELLEVWKRIEGEKHVAILGCTSEESTDTSLADLAAGLGARFIKLGGLLRGERTTKYNRLLAIEEELRGSGTLGTNGFILSFLSARLDSGMKRARYKPNLTGERARYKPNLTGERARYKPNLTGERARYKPNLTGERARYKPNLTGERARYKPNLTGEKARYKPNLTGERARYKPNLTGERARYKPNLTGERARYKPNLTGERARYKPNLTGERARYKPNLTGERARYKPNLTGERARYKPNLTGERARYKPNLTGERARYKPNLTGERARYKPNLTGERARYKPNLTGERARYKPNLTGERARYKPNLTGERARYKPNLTGERARYKPNLTGERARYKPNLTGERARYKPNLTGERARYKPNLTGERARYKPNLTGERARYKPNLTGERARYKPNLTGERARYKPNLTGERARYKPNLTGERARYKPNLTGERARYKPNLTGERARYKPNLTGERARYKPNLTGERARYKPNLTGEREL
ncbi:enolase 4 [Pelodytes ibericus]